MKLKVEDVAFSYPGGVEVLKKASFSVGKGEVVAIIGPNGSGKTTLLMISAGLLKPKRGRVLLDGEPLEKQLPEARRKIGLVFQDPDDQLFNPTVYDEISFAPRQLLPSKEEVRNVVFKVAEELGIKHLLDRPPYKLSVGEKRKVALASVLVYNPEILLLDEPTANLSASFVEELEQIIMEKRRLGKAIVVASHDVEFIARVADRVYVLSRGVTYGGSSARKVLTDEKLLALADMKPPLIHQAAKTLGLNLREPPLTLKELEGIARLKKGKARQLKGGLRPSKLSEKFLFYFNA